MFQKAQAGNKLEMVAMNQTKYVVIASPTAAILGHFSPRPPGAHADAAAGDAHIKAKMDQIFALFNNHKQNFPPDHSTGLIAYAVYRGSGRSAIPETNH